MRTVVFLPRKVLRRFFDCSGVISPRQRKHSNSVSEHSCPWKSRPSAHIYTQLYAAMGPHRSSNATAMSRCRRRRHQGVVKFNRTLRRPVRPAWLMQQQRRQHVNVLNVGTDSVAGQHSSDTGCLLSQSSLSASLRDPACDIDTSRQLLKTYYFSEYSCMQRIRSLHVDAWIYVLLAYLLTDSQICSYFKIKLKWDSVGIPKK